jgi:hypothetical protein
LAELEWTELEWSESEWKEFERTELELAELEWTELEWSESEWKECERTEPEPCPAHLGSATPVSHPSSQYGWKFLLPSSLLSSNIDPGRGPRGPSREKGGAGLAFRETLRVGSAPALEEAPDLGLFDECPHAAPESSPEGRGCMGSESARRFGEMDRLGHLVSEECSSALLGKVDPSAEAPKIAGLETARRAGDDPEVLLGEVAHSLPEFPSGEFGIAGEP